jgi:2-polyprenyl-3-methyl-5-hydroxy-6-metoxy-1,4-benzoquinol methylase
MDREFSQRYRELYENHWWFRVREQAILQLLRRRQPPGGWKTILDIGCGDALFFPELMRLGEVEGVEPVAEIIGPENPFRERIHVGSFDESFRPRKRYSLILMLDVLEHLEDPVAALRQAVSLLEPGGSLLITVPAFRLLWTSHDTLNDHFTRYTKASFRRVAKQGAMNIAESRYLFFWLFLAKLGVRAKEAILGSKPDIPKVPPPVVNNFLSWISRLEEKMLGALPVPFGSSLLVFGGAELSGMSSQSRADVSPTVAEDEPQGAFH